MAAARLSRCGLIVFALVVSSSCLVYADPDGHRKAAEITLIKALERDGDNLEKDVFETLSESQQHLWAFNNGLDVNHTITNLQENHVSMFVDVKLVGFNNDGNQQLSFQEAELQRYLHIVNADIESVVVDSGLPLVVRPHVVFRVYKANTKVLTDIETAIFGPVKAKVGDGSPLRMVEIPFTQINSIVRADYEREQHGQFTIYLLNPRQPVAPYQYDYGSGGCPGQLWVGDRAYVWIDLTAGPSRYGPGPGAQGIVLSHSIPRLSHYKKGHLNRAILPDLAAFTLSLTKHLFWPPLRHAFPKRSQHVDVHLLYLHEDLIGGKSYIQPAALEKTLQSLVRGLQTVTVKEHFVSFAACEFCTAALSSSLKTKSQRALSKTVSMETLTFLDSAEVHHWLTTYADYILSHAGIHLATDDGLPTALPVFIFDLTTNKPLLLDGESMAMAFDNMAISVLTKANPVLSKVVCSSAPVMVDVKDAARAVTAAIVQSGWAVADPAAYWHPATGVSYNYLLHVGSTPFGLLSRSTETPFVVADSASRNMVLTELNNSLTHTVTILRGFEMLARDVGGKLEKRLTGMQMSKYHERINLITFKVSESLNYLSRQDYSHAFKIARGMRHDVDALHRLARRVNKEHLLALTCPKHPLAWTIWLLPVGCVAGVALTVYVALSSQEDNWRNL